MVTVPLSVMPPEPLDSCAGIAERALLATLRLSGFSSYRVPTRAGRVHVLDGQGSGKLPTVVLLHGFSAAGVHFRGLLRRLRPHVRRLVAPDAPGHGFSDAPGDLAPRKLMAALGEALDQVIDSEPVILFGSSMGGLEAVRYALARPERVRNLVLCSPFGAPMGDRALDELRAAFEVGSHRQALAFVDRVFELSPALRHLMAWGVRRRMQHPLLREMLRSVNPDDLFRAEEVRALAPPLLLIWGQAERVLPASNLDFFLENLPANATVEQPPDFGHGPYLVDPDAVARLILRAARA